MCSQRFKVWRLRNRHDCSIWNPRRRIVEWEPSVLADFVPTEVLEQAAAVADEVVATETVENAGNSFDRRGVNGG
jgi:hypothetical protein